MSREEYDEQKYLLQVELLRFQNWAADTAPNTCSCSRVGTLPARAGIKRFMQHLNPRYAHTVALTKVKKAHPRLT